MKIVAVAKPLIADLTPAQMERIHRAAGSHQVVLARDLETQLQEVVDADILFGDITPEVIKRGRQLQWIHALGAGVDRIVESLAGTPIRLTSEKGGVGPHLAEHAFALLLAVTRGIATAIRNPNWRMRPPIREKQWELTDRTMAIVGFGGTGIAVAQRARGFEMPRVTALEPESVDTRGLVDQIYRPEQLADFLAEADVVCVTAPLTPSTRQMFNRSTFGLMKRGSILVNVSRGEIVEEEGLLEALASGRLFGAGLDVTPREPLPDDHPLWSMPNVVITPHIAGGSPRRADRAVDNF